MHFSLIDKIDVLEPHKRIVATKSLSLAEEYLQDHFPKFPVMPGVLMIEAMAEPPRGSSVRGRISRTAWFS
ncbi:MAG: hypothetical protein IJJ20_02205 [Thermoguttaceae bacterium]|nr:hypothetical protein [Thermoguttaceae bacterium]